MMTYEVLIGNDGMPIIAKTARSRNYADFIEFAEFTVRGVYFVARLCFLESRKLILFVLWCNASLFSFDQNGISVDNQETLIKFTPNVWFCHTHKTPLVALDPFYGSILFIFFRTQNYYI